MPRWPPRIEAAQANASSWREVAERLTEMMVEMAYEIEPGYACAQPAA